MELTNEEKAILKMLKSRSAAYNANSLSKELGITSMGSLKMLRRLEKEGLIVARKVSNINFFTLNFANQYAKDFAALALRKEADINSAYVKRWVNEIRGLGAADLAVIFGSVLNKERGAGDIDVLFILKKGNLAKLQKKISELNALSEKKVHPVYQAHGDFLKNLDKEDAVLLEAIKGTVAFGERDFVNLLERAK